MESNVKETEFVKKEAPAGILRTESGKSRRASVDFKLLTQVKAFHTYYLSLWMQMYI